MAECGILDLVLTSKLFSILSVALWLEVFELLSRGPMSSAELGARAGAPAGRMAALVDCCVAAGWLQCEQGRCGNSHQADAHLVRGRPLYLGDIIAVVAHEDGLGGDIHRTVTAATQPEGRPQGDADVRMFTLGMDNLAASLEADSLAEAVPLAGCSRMADVGCGAGRYTVSVCRHNPGLSSTLLDRQKVLDVAHEIIEREGMGDRIALRCADILSDPYGEALLYERYGPAYADYAHRTPRLLPFHARSKPRG